MLERLPVDEVVREMSPNYKDDLAWLGLTQRSLIESIRDVFRPRPSRQIDATASARGKRCFSEVWTNAQTEGDFGPEQ